MLHFIGFVVGFSFHATDFQWIKRMGLCLNRVVKEKANPFGFWYEDIFRHGLATYSLFTVCVYSGGFLAYPNKTALYNVVYNLKNIFLEKMPV
jgi:hypothetical protein